MSERLQKFLSRAGVCSRRAAEELIRQGQVAVDGLTVAELGLKIEPDRQRVTVKGQPVAPPGQKITVLLNKPQGYVTTMSDPQGRPVVTSLLAGIKERLFPVGRLDLDTEGALILTNDGDLAQRLLHPKFEINKTYQALVKGRPSPTAISALERGIDMDGRRTWPARIKLLGGEEGGTRLAIVIHEGRKRQVRRMFAAIGHPVVHLKRLAYGHLRLGDLPLGAYRRLSASDLDLLFSPSKPAKKSTEKNFSLYKQKNDL